MASLILILGFLTAVSWVQGIEQQTQSQFYCIELNGQVKPCTKLDPDHDVAYARYFNRINQTGWAELEVVTNERQPDDVQAYYAGYLEGYLTAPLIDIFKGTSRIRNQTFDEVHQTCGNLTGYIRENLEFTVEEVKKFAR